MKKLIMFSSFMLGAFLLAGCGQQQASQTQPMESATVAQPAQVQPATTNSPTTWQTYTDDKYGFSFEYPSELIIERKQEVSEDEDWPSGLNIGDNIMIDVVKIQQGLTNEEDPLSQPNGMEPVSRKDTTIAGLKGRIYNDGEVYVVAKNGYQYFLLIFDTEKPGKDTLSKIVASFKFTN